MECREDQGIELNSEKMKIREMGWGMHSPELGGPGKGSLQAVSGLYIVRFPSASIVPCMQ